MRIFTKILGTAIKNLNIWKIVGSFLYILDNLKTVQTVTKNRRNLIEKFGYFTVFYWYDTAMENKKKL